MPQQQDRLPDYLNPLQVTAMSSLLREYSVRIFSCVYWKNQAPWSVEWRKIADSFLLFPTTGVLRVTLESGPLLITPGDFLMLPENTPHHLELVEGYQDLEQISLHADIQDRWRLPFLQRFASPIGHLPGPAEWFEHLRHLVAIHNQDRELGQILGEALVRVLLGQQVLAQPALEARTANIDHRIERMMHFLENSYADATLSVEAAAAQVNLSPVQVRKLFRQSTGGSPKQYLGRIRLREASRLLRQTMLSVKEIAARTGFTSDHYFHAVFHRAYQCTPSEFRSRSDL
jgi:AraC-like DNA-binding protein